MAVDGPTFLHDPRGRSDSRSIDFTFGANAIGGKIFDDSNANGVQEAGELGVDGARLKLDSGEVVYTDANGEYRFTDLLPGALVAQGQAAELVAQTLVAPNGGTQLTDVTVPVVRYENVVFAPGIPALGIPPIRITIPVPGTQRTIERTEIDLTITTADVSGTLTVTPELAAGNPTVDQLVLDLLGLIAAHPTLSGAVTVGQVGNVLEFATVGGTQPATLTLAVQTRVRTSVETNFEAVPPFVSAASSSSDNTVTTPGGLGFAAVQSVSASDLRSVTLIRPPSSAITSISDTRSVTLNAAGESISGQDFGVTSVLRIDAGDDRVVNERELVSLASNLTDPNPGDGSNFDFLWEVKVQLDDSADVDPNDPDLPIAPGTDPDFSFVPPHDGRYTVTLTVTDNDAGVQYVDSVLVTALRVNKAPQSTVESYDLDEDDVLAVDALTGVLANDADPDGDPLEAQLVTGPSDGTLILGADGSLSYTPDPDFNGVDSFLYRASDGAAFGPDTEVTINVAPTNDTPVAAPEEFDLGEDSTLTVSASGVLANDEEIDGDPLAAVLVAGPENGALTLNTDGSFVYTPGLDFNGTDTFTYLATDGTVGSNTVLVTLTVNPLNDAPVGAPDVYDVDEDTTLSVDATAGVLSNDDDNEMDPIHAVLVDGPDNGTVDFNPDGSFSYTPDPDFNGVETFTYLGNDGELDSVVETLVTLNVDPVNDGPLATNEGYSVDAGDTLVVDALNGVLANDDDVDGDILSAILIDGPDNGTLTLNPDGSFNYAPDPGFDGDDTFTYQASDGSLVSATAVVSLDVLPDTFRVTGLTALNDGFTIDFSRGLDPNGLNLYDGADGNFGTSDLLLVGDIGGSIRGTLLADGAQARFLATGGPLAPDFYTVVLSSGADGFTDTLGSQLDGDADGASGDAFVSNFTVVDIGAVSVSMPDFSRGPGQPVDVPATSPGLPLTISDAAGLLSLELTLVYDPDLLTISGAEIASAVPGGATLVTDASTPGILQVSLTSVQALPGGEQTVLLLQAQVPDTAPYTAKHVIDITNLSVNGGSIDAIDDDAVHVVAYLGDTTANAAYSSLDGTDVLAVVAKLASGFEPYRLIDPRIIADVSSNGFLTSTDVGIILQEVFGTVDRLEIPVLPDIIEPIVVGGPDPLVSIGANFTAVAGETLTVPVDLDTTDGLDSAELEIAFDPSAVEILAVRTTEVTDSFFLLANTATPGIVRVDLSAIRSLGSGTGPILELDLRVNDDQAGKSIALDLRRVQLNEGNLVLSPEPIPGPDPTDGVIEVVAAPLNAQPDAQVHLEVAPVGAAAHAAVLDEDTRAVEPSRLDVRTAARITRLGELLGLARAPAPLPYPGEGEQPVDEVRELRSQASGLRQELSENQQELSANQLDKLVFDETSVTNVSADPALDDGYNGATVARSPASDSTAARIDWIPGQSATATVELGTNGGDAWRRTFVTDAAQIKADNVVKADFSVVLAEEHATEDESDRPPWRRWLA